MDLLINDKENNIMIEDDNSTFNKRDINKLIENKKNNANNIPEIEKNEEIDNSEDITIIIKSNEVTEMECYNDYMIKLENSIKLKDLNIKSITLPTRENENITEDNNKLIIEIDDNIRTIELEPNYYNRNELIEFLNEGFAYNEIPILCKINDEDKFIFLSTNNQKFKMMWDDNSILPYLGFNKSTYFNKIMYEAENSINIGDNIFYLVIENISENPLFLIDMDLKIITKLQNFNIIDNDNFIIDHLIIKFYKSKKSIIKNNNEYLFFFQNNHQLELTFT